MVITSTQSSQRPVLLVEDDPAHAELIQRCFEEQGVSRVYHVADGSDALDYLFRRGAFADPAASPRPDFIVLDLRLPKVDGLEVLQKIRSEESLSAIPVIVLSTSDARPDVEGAFESHANSYLVKPETLDEFRQLVNGIGHYWLDWNQYPAH